jgi:hypothetical protein
MAPPQEQRDEIGPTGALGALRPPNQAARVHALPCSIDHDGPAAVNTYFLCEPAKPGELTWACDSWRPSGRSGFAWILVRRL